MSRIHLPESIYERLPLFYLALAALLAVTATAPLKWLAVTVLAVAAVAIKYRRRSYRDALQWQQAAAFIDKYERHRKAAKASTPPTVEVL